MNQAYINNLLVRCIRLEQNAPTVIQRKYWDRQYRKLRKLACMLGWID